MLSPKYASDEAFRQIVETRLGITDRASWGLGEQARQMYATLAPPVELTRDDPEFGPEQGDNW